MLRYGFAAAAGFVLAAGLWTASASAAGVGGLKSAADDESLIIKVHGCHRSCEIGPAGWHRHVGPFCTRVACSPRAWYPNRCFVDRWGVRHCRW